MTDFANMTHDARKLHAESLLRDPVFTHMIEKYKKSALEAFERCDYDEVNKRDALFAKYKTIKDFVREIELLTKPKKLFTME